METQTATPVVRKRSRLRRAARVLLKAGVFLFLLVLVARLVWGFVVARQLNREISAIAAAGEPLTFSDLDRDLPAVREADDAAPYYEAAVALLRDRDADALWNAVADYRRALTGTPASRPAPELAGKVQELLERNRLALEMLDRGAACPGCSLDPGVERGMDYLLERLGRTRAAAKLLSARALVRAEEGKPDEAVDSLVSLLRWTRVFDRKPVMIVYLMRIACVSLASQDLGTVLSMTTPADAALERLETALAAVDEPGLFTRMLMAERVYSLQLMRQAIEGGGALAHVERSVLADQWPPMGFWTRPWIQRLAIGMVHDTGGFIRASRGSMATALRLTRGDGPATSQFGKLLAPALQKGFLRAAWATAEIRASGAAVRVERYRRANGRLPATLDEAGAGVAGNSRVDPYNDRPLMYRRDGRGFVVYSVGENLADDGGDVARRDQGRPPDFGVHVSVH
jgi:hypothetical protein